MMLMCGQSNQLWHYLAGAHPGKVGMLLGPSYAKKQAIRWWMPYALDNDAYGAFSSGLPWDVDAWREMLRDARMTSIPPLWVLVPDVVGDRKATIENWCRYAGEVQSIGWPTAFAAQDGMTPDDVPSDADVVFVGGTTEWKWRTVPVFARHCKRVHVGRVNELRRLWTCQDLGVESVDGSGWFRDTSEGRRGKQILAWINGWRDTTMELAL